LTLTRAHSCRYAFCRDGVDGLGHLSSFHNASDPDRALAPILFTDFVGSTKRLAEVGDSAWRDLLDSHEVIVRTVIGQHRGHLVKTTGAGILAIFDGPGRAIRCAIALRDALRPLGLEVRAGLHTGEIEIRGSDIAGIAATRSPVSEPLPRLDAFLSPPPIARCRSRRGRGASGLAVMRVRVV
jgi:hypothetical protein